MAKTIQVPKLKPTETLTIGPEGDTHKFGFVVRSSEVDEAVDEISKEYTEKARQVLNSLADPDAEDFDGADLESTIDQVEMRVRYLNILLEPLDDHSELAGDYAKKLYEDGLMSSPQIISITDQVIEIAKPS